MAKTILSVDDSSSIRQLVKLTLTGAGYQVVEAVDGRDGLAKVHKGGVDMVLTDLNMPNMDGISMIREMRALPSCRGLPIIFLTTESDNDKKSQAKAAGATAWIVKPFKQEMLLAVAKKVLGA